jgi:hypothetical protein
MREFIKEKKVKIKEKIETKKVKTKEKKNWSVSFLTKKADKLWSEAVKIEYNYSCQYCWKTEFLNSHHLFTRSRKSTRWAIDNWICLCSWCHTLSSTFSAHQTSLEFFLWLEWLRGRDWIDKLKDESNKIVKVTPWLISFQIKLLQDYILKNQNDL